MISVHLFFIQNLWHQNQSLGSIFGWQYLLGISYSSIILLSLFIRGLHYCTENDKIWFVVLFWLSSIRNKIVFQLTNQQKPRNDLRFWLVIQQNLACYTKFSVISDFYISVNPFRLSESERSNSATW